MSVSIATLRKVLVAKFALERAGPNVRSDMVFDVAELGKFLSTFQALQLLFVAPTFFVEFLNLNES